MTTALRSAPGTFRNLPKRVSMAGVAVEPLENRTLLAADPLDISFGSRGVASVGITGSASDRPSAVTVMPDGKIVAGGDTFPVVGGQHQAALARYNANGSADTTFSQDGRMLNVPGISTSNVIGLLPQ